MQTLSLNDARKLILLSQQLPPKAQSGSSLANTQHIIEQLGYVQIDTLSVVQRAHHHTLWSRNHRYKPSHLDQLQKDKKVFEYWSHAAAYLPMRDYRFSLYKKQAIKDGRQKHWHNPDPKLMVSILERIKNEGPLMAKDFGDASTSHATANKNAKNKQAKKEWSSNPYKQALETLFMRGDLMIAERRNFHKVYDIAERVIPEHANTSVPNDKEYAAFLVVRFLQAHGIGNASEISYLLKNIKPIVSSTLDEMVEQGDLVRLSVNKMTYYALPTALDLLNKPLSRSKAKILSPFDNLLIQRKRTQALFNFDYLLECYVPAAKRQFGYFCLPILWDGKLVARADCKADKKSGVLKVISLVTEPTLKQRYHHKQSKFMDALEKELQAFAAFNDCQEFHIQQSLETSS
ncbi:winged helix DNA-binding domain-containing protein [Marinomonas agarivorans]|nr:winged helix DNA-binding domain-containing protein [Marinomonas agarivorans]